MALGSWILSLGLEGRERAKTSADLQDWVPPFRGVSYGFSRNDVISLPSTLTHQISAQMPAAVCRLEPLQGQGVLGLALLGRRKPITTQERTVLIHSLISRIFTKGHSQHVGPLKDPELLGSPLPRAQNPEPQILQPFCQH